MPSVVARGIVPGVVYVGVFLGGKAPYTAQRSSHNPNWRDVFHRHGDSHAKEWKGGTGWHTNLVVVC